MKLIFEEMIPGTVKLGDHIRATKDLEYDQRVFVFQYSEHNYALIRRESDNVSDEIEAFNLRAQTIRRFRSTDVVKLIDVEVKVNATAPKKRGY